MSNRFEDKAFDSPKAKWVKPVVRQFKAGSAEINSGTNDDADVGNGLNNS